MGKVVMRLHTIRAQAIIGVNLRLNPYLAWGSNPRLIAQVI